MMNWQKLGKGGGGQRGAGAGKSAAEAAEEARFEAAWKKKSLPKSGDMLQCDHFKTCSGCEFDRRFDETPIMVDSM